MFSLSHFQQVLQSMPWGAFDQAVQMHKADRHVKRFGCREHLKAMSYAQLSDVGSLRELEASFNQHECHRYHLRMAKIKRTTLADANSRRNPQVFAHTAAALMQHAGRSVRRHRHYMVYLLDSTSIALRGRGFEWTAPSATRTPGLKLHLLYASDSFRPVQHSITAANVNDVDEGRNMPIERGAIYVFDKGYCDYSWWGRIVKNGAHFVTRAKSNAALKLERELPIEQADAAVILGDRIESFRYKSNRGGHRHEYEGRVRRIWVAREENARDKQPLVLLTNNLDSPARDIAALYKERWQIELFFKWIKQHLSVKRFLGRSENAVRIQLLVALIVYLMVLLYRAKHGLQASLWHVLAQLRGGLMQRSEPQSSAWKRARERDTYIQAVQPNLL